MDNYIYAILAAIFLGVAFIVMIADTMERSSQMEFDMMAKEAAFRECNKQTENWDACFNSIFNDFKG